MKKSNIVIIAALMISLLCTGCSDGSDNLKDNIVNGYDNLIQSVSKNALTKQSDLQGKKESGNDEYTGTYTASYDGFNGKEFIFGGTALERDKGSNLEATYNLEVNSGNAVLYWLTGGEEHVIADVSADDTFAFTMSAGDNYIVLEGENFSGNLELKVE